MEQLALKPSYGQDAGDQLTALLKDHIAIAVSRSAATMTDTTGVEHATAHKRGLGVDPPRCGRRC